MLLTGDARGDKILEGMDWPGCWRRAATMHVDLLKVPHHGSDNNMETIFFKRVPADHYVFSGDGEHGNPERDTLEMLLDARGADAEYTIHLTYPLAEIDAGRKADWEKEQAKERPERRRTRRPRSRCGRTGLPRNTAWPPSSRTTRKWRRSSRSSMRTSRT